MYTECPQDLETAGVRQRADGGRRLVAHTPPGVPKHTKPFSQSWLFLLACQEPPQPSVLPPDSHLPLPATPLQALCTVDCPCCISGPLLHSLRTQSPSPGSAHPVPWEAPEGRGGHSPAPAPPDPVVPPHSFRALHSAGNTGTPPGVCSGVVPATGLPCDPQLSHPCPVLPNTLVAFLPALSNSGDCRAWCTVGAHSAIC